MKTFKPVHADTDKKQFNVLKNHDKAAPTAFLAGSHLIFCVNYNGIFCGIPRKWMMNLFEHLEYNADGTDFTNFDTLFFIRSK